MIPSSCDPLRRARPRFGAAVLALALLLGTTLGSRAAFAEDRRSEATAKDAIKRARIDYAAKAYQRAVARLRRADHACSADRCTAPTKAALLRDIGSILFRMGELDAPESLFKEALKLDPAIDLNPAYNAPDLRGAWAEAKEQAGVSLEQQPAGDFVHTPPRESPAKTPLPIYVEYRGEPPASVVVKYKSATMTAWKRMELPRLGSGWGGTIPCGDIALGAMRYFIQGFDTSGVPILNSGDPKRPFSVLIREDTTAPPPSLPGQKPPSACGESEAAAVPPEDLAKKSNGESCEKDDECVSAVCEHGSCAEPAPESTEGNFARVWLGVSGSFDFESLPTENDVCKLNQQAAPVGSYACTNPDGTDFPSHASPVENGTLNPGNAGQSGGGLTAGNIRLALTLDYALGKNFLVGGRFGLVLDAYPGQTNKPFFAPLHLEARATYLFGDNPLGRPGFAPMLFAAAGAAEFSADTTVLVTQTRIPGQSSKQAWLFAGPGFVAAGGGTRYAFSQRIGFLADLKITFAFGHGFVPIFGPEFALQFGF